MGGVQTALKWGWGGVPDTERATYFPERLMMGWFELLCCPTAMGCTIVNFKPKHPNGGEPKYKIKLRLSHSEHVHRYQLHVVQDGSTKEWIVGHMEKTETHLRAKPGEFVRAQIWNLTSNSMHMEARRSALQRKSQPCMNAVKLRPTPSAKDMMMMGLSIATQAKLDESIRTSEMDDITYDKSTERWVQVIGVDDRAYKLTIEPPRISSGRNKRSHPSMKSMNVLRILHRGKKVCVARKQRFAGALGKVDQPFLGVQIKPTELRENVKRPEDEGGEDEDDGMPKPFLDTKSLMLLLLCLAWSEETMSAEVDMTDRFVQAMETNPGRPGSAAALGLSVQWDTEDVQQRLKHIEYARLHKWSKTPLEPSIADHGDPDEDGEGSDEPNGSQV
eukprot:CAMPEP_0180452036 /NCGR_PEP_ID=MMETSP1036_2-20121128/19045_1 /TAXON_ID=632150 /ORGANISM="Azadinium spinosum, Strain 3D9" /LENGTH=388 /DNA_ID=CAMNT_0022458491 /DNA_START=30 /DNA_END=1196 /DNA_ORIENTATION=+